MGLLSKRKKVDDNNVVFNEDNVVRVSEYNAKEPAVIEVSLAVRIVNIIGVIFSLLMIFAIIFTVYIVLQKVGFIDSLRAENGFLQNFLGVFSL